VKVESIHCKKQEVDVIHEGQYSSVSLTGESYDPNEVSKGMSLVGINTTLVPKAVRKFKADVWWIGEEQCKEMKYKCEPVVIINHIRETCKIVNLNKNNNCLTNKSFTENSSTSVSITSRTESFIDLDDEINFTKKKKKIKTNMKENTFCLFRDEKVEIVFEFKNFPKYINEGQNIIINDNTFKAFGIITKVFYSDDELFGRKKMNK
jgi:GTPase